MEKAYSILKRTGAVLRSKRCVVSLVGVTHQTEASTKDVTTVLKELKPECLFIETDPIRFPYLPVSVLN